MKLKEKLNSAMLSCIDKCKKVWLKIKNTLKSEISLTRMCLILSAYTLIVFHGPFYEYLMGCEITLSNGLMILATVTILMLVINFLVYYILIYLGRVVGKVIICLTLIGNAVALYFINTYNVLIDMQMMGNVFHTQSNEASGFLSWTILLYVLVYGIPPCIWIFYKKIRYEKIWKFILTFFTSIVIVIGSLACNIKNVLWIDYHAPIIGSKILPWSYIVNSIRYYNYWKFINQPEIKLPDAKIATDSRDIFYRYIFEQVKNGIAEGTPIAGCNFWGWGGCGRPRDLVWQAGDDYLSDPPHEPQGWYSVFDCDTTTIGIIKEYSKAITE
jgi:lipid A ethanolaminephosphotransferase